MARGMRGLNEMRMWCKGVGDSKGRTPYKGRGCLLCSDALVAMFVFPIFSDMAVSSINLTTFYQLMDS